jgi:lipocalin-like protein
MRCHFHSLIAIVIAVTSPSSAFAQSAKDKLLGAWHLVSMEEPASDGKLKHITGRTGQLIYTRDGHMSVQLMYPPSESGISNDYVLNGYEASFGSYDVDESAHTVTHHVQASITRGLIGKDLPRAFQFSNGNLIIKSVRPDEHWSVTWHRD